MKLSCDFTLIGHKRRRRYILKFKYKSFSKAILPQIHVLILSVLMEKIKVFKIIKIVTICISKIINNRRFAKHLHVHNAY